MEIVNENVAMLSNYEVYEFLTKSQKQAKKNRRNGRSQELATITYETADYLSRTACATQNPDRIRKLLLALGKYNLTKAEKLLIVNLKPTSLVEIQLVIEENEERLTEDEVSELLELVAAHLVPQSENNQ